jgi:hypothetical protein
MRISDLVIFSNDRFFNGAVQTEWYYDQLRVGKIAASYVFHGPKYYESLKPMLHVLNISLLTLLHSHLKSRRSSMIVNPTTLS